MDWMTTTVTQIEDVGPDALAITANTPTNFTAQPGQFVRVRVERPSGSVDRYYTVSSPFVSKTFEMTVTIDPGGELSPWFETLSSGDTIQFSGPFGATYYTDEEHTIALGSGPGIGPAIAVAERTLAEGGTTTVICHGEDILHESRLADLAANGSSVYFTDSDERFTETVTSLHETGSSVFVYGFSSFAELAKQTLDEAGYPAENVSIENFG